MIFFFLNIMNHFFMRFGATFQIFAASLTNVEVKILQPYASLSWFVTAALVLFSWLTSFLLGHFVGCDSQCWDFYTSRSLIWALIWFTPYSFNLSQRMLLSRQSNAYSLIISHGYTHKQYDEVWTRSLQILRQMTYQVPPCFFPCDEMVERIPI